MSTRPAVGIATIGQSPRTDVVPDIAARLPPGTVLLERGALDEADRAELDRLAPLPGEDLLVTRLRDGTEVTLAEARLMPLVHAAVDHMTDRGATIVALLCTGPLAPLPSPVPLLLPARLVRDRVAAAASGTRLGVVVPAPGQIASARADWPAAAEAVLPLAASPYGSSEALRRAATMLAAWRPDLVLLDCLGFNGPMKQMVADLAGSP
jgi:protein AroM